MSVAQIILILLSLLLSAFTLAANLFIEYKLIKTRRTIFKLDDVMIICFLCIMPILNLFMLLAVTFRTWAYYDLSNIVTKYIRGEKE